MTRWKNKGGGKMKSFRMLCGLEALCEERLPGECFTLDDIAAVCGVSKMAIWRVQAIALKKLERRLALAGVRMPRASRPDVNLLPAGCHRVPRAGRYKNYVVSADPGRKESQGSAKSRLTAAENAWRCFRDSISVSLPYIKFGPSRDDL